jgi:hypothetical protein
VNTTSTVISTRSTESEKVNQTSYLKEDNCENKYFVNNTLCHSPASPASSILSSSSTSDNHLSASGSSQYKSLHTTSPPQQHQLAQNNNKIHKCKQCMFVCNYKEDYWAHQREMHIKPERLLECTKCSFVTEYKHHLEYHLRNHIGSKPYKCNQCEYACVNLSMLRSHMKSHSKSIQYNCADCSYSTKYYNSLKNHIEKFNHSILVLSNEDNQANSNNSSEVNDLTQFTAQNGLNNDLLRSLTHFSANTQQLPSGNTMNHSTSNKRKKIDENETSLLTNKSLSSSLSSSSSSSSTSSSSSSSSSLPSSPNYFKNLPINTSLNATPLLNATQLMESIFARQPNPILNPFFLNANQSQIPQVDQQALNQQLQLQLTLAAAAAASASANNGSNLMFPIDTLSYNSFPQQDLLQRHLLQQQQKNQQHQEQLEMLSLLKPLFQSNTAMTANAENFLKKRKMSEEIFSSSSSSSSSPTGASNNQRNAKKSSKNIDQFEYLKSSNQIRPKHSNNAEHERDNEDEDVNVDDVSEQNENQLHQTNSKHQGGKNDKKQLYECIKCELLFRNYDMYLAHEKLHELEQISKLNEQQQQQQQSSKASPPIADNLVACKTNINTNGDFFNQKASQHQQQQMMMMPTNGELKCDHCNIQFTNILQYFFHIQTIHQTNLVSNPSNVQLIH